MTDLRWRTAYAACREVKGHRCACERDGKEPCPKMSSAASAVERVLSAEPPFIQSVASVR